MVLWLAVHRAEWQTITWILVSAIICEVLIGPNLVSVALAVLTVFVVRYLCQVRPLAA